MGEWEGRDARTQLALSLIAPSWVSARAAKKKGACHCVLSVPAIGRASRPWKARPEALLHRKLDEDGWGSGAAFVSSSFSAGSGGGFWGAASSYMLCGPCGWVGGWMCARACGGVCQCVRERRNWVGLKCGREVGGRRPCLLPCLLWAFCCLLLVAVRAFLFFSLFLLSLYSSTVCCRLSLFLSVCLFVYNPRSPFLPYRHDRGDGARTPPPSPPAVGLPCCCISFCRAGEGAGRGWVVLLVLLGLAT